MKKKLTYISLLISLIVSMLGSPLLVHAETAMTSPSPTTSTTTAETNDEKGRAARIVAYRKELKETLTDAAKLRIISRCEAAQNVIKGKTTSNNAVTAARTKAYTAILTELQSLAVSLSAKGTNVVTLNANIVALQTKITAFDTANKTYMQALSDAAALDCKTDPTAFKATLEMARTDQKAVFTAAQAIRTYINDTIKVTLNALKDAAGTDKKVGM